MSETAGIIERATLDLSHAPVPWPFAIEQAAAIDAHWARCIAQKPGLFNGRVLTAAGYNVFALVALLVLVAYFSTHSGACSRCRRKERPWEPGTRSM